MKKWVNGALQVEQNPNTLVMKLQLLMQVISLCITVSLRHCVCLSMLIQFFFAGLNVFSSSTLVYMGYTIVLNSIHFNLVVQIRSILLLV